MTSARSASALGGGDKRSNRANDSRVCRSARSGVHVAAAGALHQIGREDEIGLAQLVRPGEHGAQLPAVRGPGRERRDRRAPSACARRRSAATGLPVVSVSPQMPSMSSTSWKAMPRWCPYSASSRTCSASAPYACAPRLALADSRLAVLPGLHPQALLDGRRLVPLELQILALARDQLLHHRAERGHRGRAVLGQHLEREGLQRAAGEQGLVLAEHGPRGRPVPPVEVAVHDVVVQQREVVDQLDGHRGVEHGGLVARGADRARAEHGQGRAQRLAAGAVRIRAAVGVLPAEVVAGDARASPGAARRAAARSRGRPASSSR